MLKELSGFCRRVGISYNAGLSLVDAVQHEAARQRRPQMWLDIAESMKKGDSFAGSLKPFHKKLGDMFVALIEVGEESGKLGNTLMELADYYDQMLAIRRDFLRAITWPVIQLVLALGIIGLLILVLGLDVFTKNGIDVLGLGLVGISGFTKYLLFLAFVATGGVFLYRFMKQNASRSRPVHYFLLRIPKIGTLLRSLALMKLSWSLHLTMRTGMDVRRALRLSFQAVGFAPVGDNVTLILRVLENGGTLADAFELARHLDKDFVMSVDSGEQSGSLPELMERLTERYRQESLLNLKIVSTFGGFAVYGIIALCIIFMIFRVFSFYMGILSDALSGI